MLSWKPLSKHLLGVVPQGAEGLQQALWAIGELQKVKTKRATSKKETRGCWFSNSIMRTSKSTPAFPPCIWCRWESDPCWGELLHRITGPNKRNFCKIVSLSYITVSCLIFSVCAVRDFWTVFMGWKREKNRSLFDSENDEFNDIAINHENTLSHPNHRSISLASRGKYTVCLL